MSETFFILGTQRELAREEIAALAPGLEVVVDKQEVLIVSQFDGNLGAWQDKLGGTVKTGLIYGIAQNKEEVMDLLVSLAQTLRPSEGRQTFGISIYDGGQRGRHVALRTQLQTIGMTVKKRLAEGGRSVRLVTAAAPVLSSVIVRKQRLLEDGIEFCLFAGEEGIRIGVTESVQDFETWSRRDFGKPKRDPKRGMLPPKLARMLVHFAQGNPESDTILDPCCGMGTVLAEAAVVGYSKLIGGDVDALACEGTRENLAWEFSTVGHAVDLSVLHARVEQIHTFLAPDSIARIVTEGTLGRPKHGDETREELRRELEEISQFTREAFRALARVLTPGGTLVWCAPASVCGREVLEVDLLPHARLFGLKPLPFFSRETTTQGALRYGREGQSVYRDVFRFIK